MRRIIIALIIAILFRIFIIEITKEPQVIEVFIETKKIENINKIHQDTLENLKILEEGIKELQPDNTIPLSLELQIHLKEECKKHKVDIDEAISIMLVENPTINPELIHHNNNGTIDVGLFQINSCRFKQFKDMGLDDLLDPKQNITAGIYVISSLNKYKNELKYIAYNAGEGGMKSLLNRGIDSTVYSRRVMNKLIERRKLNE